MCANSDPKQPWEEDLKEHPVLGVQNSNTNWIILFYNMFCLQSEVLLWLTNHKHTFCATDIKETLKKGSLGLITLTRDANPAGWKKLTMMRDEFHWNVTSWHPCLTKLTVTNKQFIFLNPKMCPLKFFITNNGLC